MKFKRQGKNGSGSGATLDLTPIVDVVFNLLIFFALSLNFAATSGGINVKLPSASTAEPVKAEQVTINLTKDGKVYYNDKTVDLEELDKRLKDVEDKDSLVIIRADNDVPHGKVVEIMDLAKSEGLSKLAFAVQSGPAAGAAEEEKEDEEEQ
jgi:biopolymer transport protein ExbD